MLGVDGRDEIDGDWRVLDEHEAMGHHESRYPVSLIVHVYLPEASQLPITCPHLGVGIEDHVVAWDVDVFLDDGRVPDALDPGCGADSGLGRNAGKTGLLRLLGFRWRRYVADILKRIEVVQELIMIDL